MRAALVPSLVSSAEGAESLTTPATLGFSVPTRDKVANPNDPAIAVHTLKASHLDKIQKLLLRGERRAAYQYAADEKLWAHAMVIASSIVIFGDVDPRARPMSHTMVPRWTPARG